MLFVVCLTFSGVTRADLNWYWQDDFSKKQESKLTSWIQDTQAAVERSFGKFPFEVHIYFHKARWPDEPVPWANTDRRYQQAVHFHVDKNASLKEFKADWTAPHELSHLIFPYLGTEHSWFAEGFASYLQYLVMEEMGEITKEQRIARYEYHMNKAANGYRYSTKPFKLAAKQLARDRNFPAMYWGGAIYFLQVDAELHRQGKSLKSVLKEYLNCCRMRTKNLEHLISQLDAIAKSSVFQNTYTRFEKNIGFPEYKPFINEITES